MQERISSLQVFCLSFIIVVPTLILSVPASLAKDVGAIGWVSVILAGLSSTIPHYILLRASTNFSNNNIIEDCISIFGSTLGKIIIIPYLVIVLFDSSFILYESIYYISFNMSGVGANNFYIAISLLAIYMVYTGIENLSRVSEVIVVIFFFTVSIITFIVVFDRGLINFARFKPQIFNPKRIIKGSILPVLWFIMIPNVLLMLKPYFVDNKKSIIGSLYCNLFIQIMMSCLFLISIITLGVDLTSKLNFPIYDVTKLAIRGFEILVFITWIMGTFLKVSLFYFIATKVIAELFQLNDYIILIIPFAILITSFSIFSYGSILLESIANYMVLGELLFGYGLTLVLFIIVYLFFGKKPKIKEDD